MYLLSATITIHLLFIIPFQIYATSFQFLQYRVEDGLNTDIIKAVEEDSLGFLLIASDQGLMQYNGINFIHYPKASGSPFVKDLIKLRNGRLLVLDDLGLNEIVNLVDTVYFKQILPGGRTPTDTSIWYPKSIFEDSMGNLWIGEPQSVVRYNGKKIDRIEFGPMYNSSSFIRSFSFVELPDNKILISSYNGQFLRYDNKNGSLEFLNQNQGIDQINHLLNWNGQIYVGCKSGLYQLQSITNDNLVLKKLMPINNISFMTSMNESEMLVCTFSTSAYIYDIKKQYTPLPYKLTVANQCFQSRKGNIWLSTEKGLVLLKPQIFERIKAERENIYVESVALSQDGQKVFFSSKEHLRFFHLGDDEAEVIDIRRDGYFLSLQMLNDQLWVSNGAEILLYNHKNEVVSTYDFSTYGRYIFDLVVDKDENVWFTQEAAIGLKRITPSGEVEFFAESAGLNEELTITRIGSKGVYAGSDAPDSYLYFKNYDDDQFRNISLPITFPYTGDLRIEDIDVDGDTIWMASSIGVLRQTNTEIKKIFLEKKFENLIVRAIEIQRYSPYVWFSNAYGLIQYNKNTGEYNVYDESHGLPSNTINTRGFKVNNESIWVGTASGLSYSDHDFLTLKNTPKPYIVQFMVDNHAINISNHSNTQLPFNPYIEVAISSPSYPSNKLRYQYKIVKDESLPNWINVPEGNLLVLSKLKSGSYNLFFRAKEIGNYDWSETNHFHFTINKSFYETLLFKSGIMFLVLLLIFMTRNITSRVLKKRHLELEKLVEERTAELAHANENLMARNQELDQFVYSTSHDLSAPLKSIRGLINIANYETSVAGQQSLLERMNESVIKLEKFIKDVISYSRNSRLEIKLEVIKLNDMVQEVLEHISNIEHFEKIKFTIDIAPGTVIYSDETRVKIILNNLLSNAVKFQRNDESIEQQVLISYKLINNKHQIMVSDNGQGIPAEFLDKIFQMFYRANYTSDGSGLGLYILSETINKLHGEVNVESKEGEGSTFTVCFP